MSREHVAYTHAKATLNAHVQRCKLCTDGVERKDAEGNVTFTFCDQGEYLSTIADQNAEALNRLEPLR